MYAQGDQSTDEFSDMLDRAYGQLGRDQPTDDFMAPRHEAPGGPPDAHHPSTEQHLWTPGAGTGRPDPPARGGGGFRNYP
jgi:hypothetical protein